MNTFILKKGDRQPSIRASFVQADGVPISLITAQEVRLKVKDDTDVFLDRPVTIIDPSFGRVGYDWEPGDTDRVGTFRAEFVITFEDGTEMTVPNDDYMILVVMEDLS